MLTGESTPLAREAGDRVLAGSLNYDGAVVCRASRWAKNGAGANHAHGGAGAVVPCAHGAACRPSQCHLRARRAGVALITFVAWIVTTHSISLALANTVAVLVIACPCAMGLAVPAALTVAVGRGAQLGVLFKGGEALERLAHLDVIVLDKTGTLTVGRPVLASCAPRTGYREDDLLRMAAAAEERSNHPLAHAIVDFARARASQWKPAADVQIIPGRGLTASVEGHDCLLGNEALFAGIRHSLP